MSMFIELLAYTCYWNVLHSVSVMLHVAQHDSAGEKERDDASLWRINSLHFQTSADTIWRRDMWLYDIVKY